MMLFKYKVYCAAVASLAILVAGCSTASPSQTSEATSHPSATGISTLTGGAEAQPDSHVGVTPRSNSSGIGNLTGGAEARPSSDAGVTPSVPAKK